MVGIRKKGLVIGSLIFFGAIFFGAIWSLWGLSGLMIAAATIGLGALVIFLVVYFVLAPKNLFFTFVEEGTAKIIMRGATVDKETGETKGGAVEKVLVQWTGHSIDKDGNIIKGAEKKHILGGLRTVGLWPLKRVFNYRFSWRNIRADGTIVEHNKELLDYVLLKTAVYLIEVFKAEDLNLLPLDLRVTLTARIINPIKCLFNVENWLKVLVNRIEPHIRNVVSHKSYEDWIKEKERIGEEILKCLEEENLIKDFKDEYGVEIIQIEVREINPPSDYREATIKEYLGEKEAQRIEKEVVLPAILGFAEIKGISVKQLQQEIQKNKKLEGELRNYIKEMILKLKAIEGGAYKKIEIDGAGGIEKTICNAIALFKELGTENTGKGKSKKGGIQTWEEWKKKYGQ